jgi:phospholipid transport system substrate-binding protein
MGAVPALSSTPIETVQTRVNAVLDVLKDPALVSESARQVKSDKIWAIAQTMFDFTELSKRTLGKEWLNLNSKQRQDFTDLFSRLLESVYRDRILAYKDEKVVFEKEIVKSSEYAEVESKIVTATEHIGMGYRVVLKDGQWKVYDVVIEGVSLITNYRSQFKEILRDKTADDLIQIIREKVEKL